jgi:hypothetical protein
MVEERKSVLSLKTSKTLIDRRQCHLRRDGDSLPNRRYKRRSPGSDQWANGFPLEFTVGVWYSRENVA